MNDLLDKLELIHQRWLQIGEEITKPDIMSDMKNYVKLSKDYKELQAVVEAYKKYKDVTENIANAKEIIAKEKDEEFRKKWESWTEEQRQEYLRQEAEKAARREEAKKQREEFKKRISNIRGIALRIPLLMYGGADAGDPNEDLTVDNFTR